MPPTTGPLAQERNALRRILDRLMAEESGLENLCRLAPRLISVAANVARIEAALESGKETEDLDALRKALRDLESTQSEEEETSW